MGDLLAVFKSRSQAMDLYSRLSAARIRCAIVNTPKAANVGCGLSVKFDRAALQRVTNIVRAGRYSAFYGFFTLLNAYGGTSVRRL